MGLLLLGNLSVNDQGTGRFLITKASKAPKGNSESPWSLHIGTFRKLILMISSKRLEVGLLAQGKRLKSDDPNILFLEWVVNGIFASPNSSTSPAKIDDLHLKSAQNGRFSQPLTSGRSLHPSS
jgi:hypothetical protein